MEGDAVIWVDENGTQYSGEIYKVNKIDYDIVLNERNVPFERLYLPIGEEPKKGNIGVYNKNGAFYEVLIVKVDWGSQSCQVRMVFRNVSPDTLFRSD